MRPGEAYKIYCYRVYGVQEQKKIKISKKPSKY